MGDRLVEQMIKSLPIILKSFLIILKSFIDREKDWERHFQLFLFIYRTA